MWKAFLLIALASNMHGHGTRIRRHLIFNPGSTLFLSVDVRDNIFEYSDFFAQAVGFKVSWALPDRVTDPEERAGNQRLQRRDLHRGMENLFNRYGFNGSSCMRKFEREAKENILNGSPHWFARVLSIVFGGNEASAVSKDNFPTNQYDSKDCPLSLISSTLTAT